MWASCKEILQRLMRCQRAKRGYRATHGSYGNQFVKVVDVDVDKDAVHPGEYLLGCRQKVFGTWNTWSNAIHNQLISDGRVRTDTNELQTNFSRNSFRKGPTHSQHV